MTDVADRISVSLEALLARFGRMVRRVGRDHGLADVDVDEVLQEVRIRIWKARSEDVAALNASYVHRTAVSAALDVLRRRRRERTVPLAETSEQSYASGRDAAEAERELDGAELARQVARAVDGLVLSRRPVVRMHLQGYPREEIARLLGWSEAKTRNLLYRGLADLRAALLSQGIGPEGHR